MKDNKKIAYIAGQVAALTVISCLAACICGAVVSLTLKFLAWIF